MLFLSELKAVVKQLFDIIYDALFGATEGDRTLFFLSDYPTQSFNFFVTGFDF